MKVFYKEFFSSISRDFFKFVKALLQIWITSDFFSRDSLRYSYKSLLGFLLGFLLQCRQKHLREFLQEDLKKFFRNSSRVSLRNSSKDNFFWDSFRSSCRYYFKNSFNASSRNSSENSFRTFPRTSSENSTGNSSRNSSRDSFRDSFLIFTEIPTGIIIPGNPPEIHLDIREEQRKELQNIIQDQSREKCFIYFRENILCFQ